MSDPKASVNPDSHQEILPPVQPPSAGFLMQLFVIPLVIVGVIVMSALLITWLARRGADPEKLFEGLSSGNAGSWQKALDIANLLSDPGNDELRHNEKIATKLDEILQEQLTEGSLQPKQIDLRVYLCSSLGRMETKGNNLNILAEAVNREQDVREIKVRIAAVVAMTRRIESGAISRESIRENEFAMNALINASDARSDEKDSKRRHGLLRETAAYALGVVGGEKASRRLGMLLRDARPTVRYNAAVALARNGDSRSLDGLFEMLDLELKLNDSDGRPADDATRNEILRTAILASFELLKSKPAFPDAERLRIELKKIVESDNVLSSVKLLIKNGFKELGS